MKPNKSITQTVQTNEVGDAVQQAANNLEQEQKQIETMGLSNDGII